MNIKKLLTTLSDLDKPVIRESVKQPIKTESRKATSLSDKLLESFGLFEAEVATVDAATQNSLNVLQKQLSAATTPEQKKGIQAAIDRLNANVQAKHLSAQTTRINANIQRLENEKKQKLATTGPAATQAHADAEYIQQEIDKLKAQLPGSAASQPAATTPTKHTQPTAPKATVAPGGNTKVLTLQQELKAAGANLGTFGVNKDGLDGRMGKYTAQALLANPKIAGKYPDLKAQAEKIIGAKPAQPASAQPASAQPASAQPASAQPASAQPQNQVDSSSAQAKSAQEVENEYLAAQGANAQPAAANSENIAALTAQFKALLDQLK